MGDDDPVVGRVLRWSVAEGRGVLRSDFGRVSVHVSAVRDRPDGLEPGAWVWFRADRPGQDGCELRATDVWAAGPPPAAPEQAADRSALTADPPDGPPPPRP